MLIWEQLCIKKKGRILLLERFLGNWNHRHFQSTAARYMCTLDKRIKGFLYVDQIFYDIAEEQ